MLASSIALCCLIGLISGCRGRAHEDVYRAKMANEIRVLEDQLYDADYQNRVLRDELDRDQGSEQAVNPIPQKRILNQSPPRISDPIIENDGQSSPGDYEILELDPPSSPEHSTQDDPESTDETKPASGFPKPPAAPAPLVDPPKQGLGMPSEAIPTPNKVEPEGPFSDLPPPTELIPPGEGELMDDQIIPGPLLPPDEDPDAPPGKVTKPKGSKTMGFEPPSEPTGSIPDHLELHDGLSGGHQFDADAEVDGLYLIVTVADEQGRTLSLDGFDVDADLTVVVLDPNDDSDDARIGRWDFKPEQVRALVRRTPIDGIHIPIIWQDRIPTSKDVIVHVRMAAAEDEMVCQGRIRLAESVAVSNWLPRG